MRIERWIILILGSALLRMLWRQYRRQGWRQTKDQLPRHWQPKSPADGPLCGAETERTPEQRLGVEPREPYAESQSRRGRKKSVQTEGDACPDVDCKYYGVTEASSHALVGHSKLGEHKDIQRLKCQACGGTFSCRKGTPLYYVKTEAEEVEEARGLWLAIDPKRKALLALQLGLRGSEDADIPVHKLKRCLHTDCVPACTTDGLRSYFYAVTAHFGRWFRPPRARRDPWQVDERLLQGQLVKRPERRQLTYTITRMWWGKRKALNDLLEQQDFRQLIQTAFIERVNLTIRQGVSLLTRRTWSLPQTEHHLLYHVEGWRCY